MLVEFHGNGIPVTNSIFRWTHDRLLAALGQHELHVGRVEVRLRDLNGPRGGDDKECDLLVHLQGRALVVVKEHQSDLYAAIRVASGRLKNVIARRLAKRRRRRQRRLDHDTLRARSDGDMASF